MCIPMDPIDSSNAKLDADDAILVTEKARLHQQPQYIVLTTTGNITTEPRRLPPSVPILKPKCVWPRRYSPPLMFLKRIDHIEINETKVVDGVVFYVIDVFVKYHVNRIPTNRSTRTTYKEPDYRVERRFTEFETLRRKVAKYCKKEHNLTTTTTCRYCESFRPFVGHCYSQPRMFVKLWTGKEARKKLFTTFINRLLQLTVGQFGDTCPRFESCTGFDVIPVLVEQFMRNHYVL